VSSIAIHSFAVLLTAPAVILAVVADS
jgi:hypothetical protein